MIVQISPKRCRALKLGLDFENTASQDLQLAALIKFKVDLGYTKGQLKGGHRDIACKLYHK